MRKKEAVCIIGFIMLMIPLSLLLTGCPQHVDSLYGLKVVGDGSGGAFVVYEDGLGGNVYVQKISPDGKLIWENNGTFLGRSDSKSYLFSDLSIVSDNSSGAIVTWYFIPPEASNNSHRFNISKLASDGSILWQKDFWKLDRMISDGSGGAVFVYKLEEDLYVNGIDSDGNEKDFFSDRIAPSSSFESNIVSCDMTTDGEGGAIIVWNETQYTNGQQSGTGAPTYKVYAVRASSNGSISWGYLKNRGGKGLSVYEAPSGTRIESLQATSDGKGGVIISWFQTTEVHEDNGGHKSLTTDIVAQNIDSSGNIIWNSNGISLKISEEGGKPRPTDGKLIVEDGVGGAIIGWRDFREPAVKASIFAQRINPDGNILWYPGGIKLSTTSLNPQPSMVSDGSGSIIASYSFQEDRKILNVQKLDKDGITVWQENGVSITDNGFTSSDISPDGQGGIIIAWGKGNLNSEEAFVQRVSSDGKLLWGAGISLNK